MRFMNRYRKPLSVLTLAVFAAAIAPASTRAEYNPQLGRFMQRDPNGTGLIVTPGLAYQGDNPTVTVSMAYTLQYGDGMNFYEYLRSDPANRRDPAGLFSYGELLSTTAIQGTLGGMTNGLTSKFAGGNFWEAFATGAISGAMGGGAGYAFAASRAGFVGTVVVRNAVEGFVGDAAGTFYSTGDFKDALVQGLYGTAMNVAAGGFFELGGRSIRALGIADSIPKRKNSDLPAFGPGSFRDRMVQKWGIDPPGYDAHHVFPLELANDFRRVGIEPDKLEFGAWWESASHGSKALEYENIWRGFLMDSPSMEQVLDKARELAGKYGFQVSF